MAIDGLYISGYFSDNDNSMLSAYADELKGKGFRFYVRNLSGTMMQSAFDFADFELIAVAYEVLQQFILNCGYDATKYFFKKLWLNITKSRESKIPFTISIEGIPTINGAETIKCKIQGQLSDEQKEKALDKVFSLAHQVENHQYQLMEKNQYYNALNGHLFRYDLSDDTLHEIDIVAEVKKNSQKQ